MEVLFNANIAELIQLPCFFLEFFGLALVWLEIKFRAQFEKFNLLIQKSKKSKLTGFITNNINSELIVILPIAILFVLLFLAIISKSKFLVCIFFIYLIILPMLFGLLMILYFDNKGKNNFIVGLGLEMASIGFSGELYQIITKFKSDGFNFTREIYQCFISYESLSIQNCILNAINQSQ